MWSYAILQPESTTKLFRRLATVARDTCPFMSNEELCKPIWSLGKVRQRSRAMCVRACVCVCGCVWLCVAEYVCALARPRSLPTVGADSCRLCVLSTLIFPFGVPLTVLLLLLLLFPLPHPPRGDRSSSCGRPTSA